MLSISDKNTKKTPLKIIDKQKDAKNLFSASLGNIHFTIKENIKPKSYLN